MSAERTTRPDPEALLRRFEADQRTKHRGKLKVFLGYASGVGKSYRMLDEGRRRSERGQDVVVAAVQPKMPPEVEALLARLETIPQRDGAIDIDRILARRPGVCLVDGLAYDNRPTARNRHRWQDIELLRNAGISVIASVNIHYIEELRESVSRLTGKTVSQTVPVAFLQEADEIEVVDAPADGVEGAKQDLREMALLLAADVVDRQLERYLESQGLRGLWGRQERILVCVTPRGNALGMVRSGQRNAERFHGELHVIHVRQPGPSTQDQMAVDAALLAAREAGARVETLEATDPMEAILDYAAQHGVTQIFVGHSSRSGWRNRWFGGPVDRLIRLAEGIDIQVFPHG